MSASDLSILLICCVSFFLGASTSPQVSEQSRKTLAGMVAVIAGVWAMIAFRDFVMMVGCVFGGLVIAAIGILLREKWEAFKKRRG
jgi:hypothetical protein